MASTTPAPFPRIFLLSPALTSGRRASLLLSTSAEFDLAQRLRRGTASLAEVYAFISGLYFRGKVAYSGAFRTPAANGIAARVIVPGIGLLSPDSMIDSDALRQHATVAVERDNDAFVAPLVRDARLLDERAGPECNYVLLGSIAADKYISPLVAVFGQRLLFPADFIGRGDMSRGGLMLRRAESGEELTYVSVQGAERRGPRPPKLEPRPPS